MKHTHSLRTWTLAVFFSVLAVSHLAVIIDAYQWPSLAARVIRPVSQAEKNSVSDVLKRRLNRILKAKNLESTRKSPRLIREGSQTAIDRTLKNAAGKIPVCGDGLVTGSEACDDRNTVAKDGCSTSCTVEPGSFCNRGQPSVCWLLCGDGIVATGEQCDDGGRWEGDGCSVKCTIELGYACEDEPSVCGPEPYCSDGVKNGNEECDDGNTTDHDGCSDTCTNEPYCGNGTKDMYEDCDDGNLVNGDGCSSSCDFEAIE